MSMVLRLDEHAYLRRRAVCAPGPVPSMYTVTVEVDPSSGAGSQFEGFIFGFSHLDAAEYDVLLPGGDSRKFHAGTLLTATDLAPHTGVFQVQVRTPTKGGWLQLGGAALLRVLDYGGLDPERITFTYIRRDVFDDNADLYPAPALTEVPALPASVTSTEFMFQYAMAFNQDISGWNVTNVTNMRGMFMLTEAFNQNISAWDVSGVEDMSYMFYWAQAMAQPLNAWAPCSATNMNYMFSYASTFNQDLSTWNVPNIASEPDGFAIGTPAWSKAKPNWGAPC